MAWLEQASDSGNFKICLRWNGRKKRKSLPTDDPKTAQAILLRFEETVALVERGRLELPASGDIMTFLLSDGKLSESPLANPKQPLTLAEISTRYLSALGNGSVEANSLETVRMHLNHLKRKLGESFCFKNLSAFDLQDYIDKRVRRKGDKSIPLTTVTLRKEIASIRACYNWAVLNGLITGAFPNKGLRFPKGEDKRPFMTWEEIDRRVGRGGLSAVEVKGLWNCLFLDLKQIDEFLAFVKLKGSRPWMHPACGVAAHTGARRSEVVRLHVDDIDFQDKTVLIHERKRVKGQRSTRRVPLTPFLERVLLDWLSNGHPGGTYLFSQTEKRGHRPIKEEPAIPVAIDDAWTHFRQTMKGSKWAVLRGWHTLRHSFASNLAAKGIDQRFIDEFMGHQTEAQRRRYRHLFPHQQRQVLCQVFGD